MFFSASEVTNDYAGHVITDSAMTGDVMTDDVVTDDVMTDSVTASLPIGSVINRFSNK
ncbi:hypothetical protein [Marinibactrum halimedae]|uniref:Uncharacterized protein n=1 Tax=Marinibactrum halimedae TaxID=1444977 RepID=A0AA37T618_9GAMM|nr:hypothetical protein [Marinibactrum halimedae]MCD9457490.1 hypothetical protein [Marinibactrum halimedae]GLS25457.1 hypothetical protein GCM10007877_11710 [Marinibactrum halimedae]